MIKFEDMKPVKLFITILIFIITYTTVCASTVRVNPTGAAKRTINLCALRDKYGFLWVGTAAGLACFDGNGKPVNTTNSGILRSTSNLRVSNIFEFGDNLLFATPNRLMLFDRKNKMTYRLPVRTKYDVEISSFVNNICEIPDSDEIWIATQGQGLFRYNHAKQELSQHSKEGSFFTDVRLADDGCIYAVSITGDIHKYLTSGEYVATYSIPGYPSNKAIINLEPIGKQIWISTGTDLYCMDVDTGSIVHKRSVPAIISSVTSCTPDRLILGTFSGVMEYDITSNEIGQIKVADMGLNESGRSLNEKINQLTKSEDGGVLITRNSGEIIEIFFIDDNFRFVPITRQFDDMKFVHALSPDNRNNGLWVGSDNGLYYYDINSGKLSTPDIKGIDRNMITSITPDGDKLWIGTANKGLVLFDSSTGESHWFRHDENTPYSLLSDEINDVFVTTRGDTYIFTRWGMCKYNPVRNEFNTLPEVSLQTEVVAMAEYYDGGLWAATINNGLLHLKPGHNRFESFISKNLANCPVNNLLMCRNGTLLASTQTDGIYVYNKEVNDFEPYKLPFMTNRSILAMQEDNEGDLWIVTDESIMRISKDGHINTNYRYTVPSCGMIPPMELLGNGDMALGGANGFQIFNPLQMSQHKFASAYPTTLGFPFETNPETLKKLGLNILLYTTDRITLPFDHNSFTIRLAANHHSDMPAITYDYMLEGFDKYWSLGSNQSEVTYSNLAPGTYRFMVRPNGLTDVETRILTIDISSPWYLTTWAFIGYAVLLLLLVFVGWLVVRNRVRKHYAHRMESLKIQRERESWESKMRFFVDLVHEIRTPLMLISLPMEQLMKNFKLMSADPEKGANRFSKQRVELWKKYIESMHTNMDYLLGITNELLDFRKVDSGTEHSLNLSRCNINMLMAEIRDRFEEPMAAENKKLVINMPDEPVIADIDRIKIDKVLMNIIGNARKYCKSITEVTLSVEDDEVVFTVSDDGSGIPPEEQSHIFDLYYQIKGDKLGASLGTGLGLAYARLIVRAHGGEIVAGESAYGGAMFKFSFPLIIVENAEYQDVYDSDTAIEAASSEETIPERSAEESLTVLVVDDNKELLEMISDGLSETYNVVTAADGVEALEKLKESNIDFIVSDVMMPRMNGIELLHNVKGNINYSHIPFIILTAKTTRESREEGMEYGADIYLEKPFSMRALIYQIENIRRTRQYFYMRRRGTEPLAVIDAEEKEAIEENKLPTMSKYDREFLEKMDSIMMENISDDMFTIDTLAERLNMSRSSFYRKIKALMGMTPVDYMKNYRLDVAASQLREKIRVNEVVANVGFTSHSYFAKCFKEKYGVLPRDYVDSLKDAR